MNKEDFENSEGFNHLEFIYNRMIKKYGAEPNVDYMIKFKEIVDKVKSEYFKKEWYEDKDSFPCIVRHKHKGYYEIAQDFTGDKDNILIKVGDKYRPSDVWDKVEHPEYMKVFFKNDNLKVLDLLASTENTTIDGENKFASIIINGLEYKEVTSPKTGKVWLDRNIGAKRVATSMDDKESYGDYLNWDKAVELADSFDGWRLPTEKELLEESKDWSNNIDAFDSFLKLPSASFCGDNPDYAYDEGSSCNIWSSSIYTNTPAYKTSWYLYIDSDIRDTETCTWYYYLSVRLIKDIE